ncbi:hypothetical protein [Neogemmobacter tilapiae]|uniref:Uncharacterized protein n=1 Tax=Neogemmobacter tilapiae TaxID=875041 RepID=A0A918TTQ1_9RHOB|nr:hypothetical protein [Gemmobacter tilapiae]GHC62145.1 hypothetical protein GCM10007315_27720 [Gemmobacter tilapiae]
MLKFLLNHRNNRATKALQNWCQLQGVTPLFISPQTVSGTIHVTVAVPTDTDVAQLGDPAPALAGLRRVTATVVSQETIDRDYDGNWYYWHK